jgi:alkaline phosphatase
MIKSSHQKNRRQLNRIPISPLFIILLSALLLLIPVSSEVYGAHAKYIILMIADGLGQKHIEATNSYSTANGEPLPLYQTDPAWTKYFISTFPHGGSYDPVQAASDFNYVLSGAVTDSAAAATNLSTGVKTQNGRISVSHDGTDRLFSIGDEARAFGKAVGAVSTVPVSHATPGAWLAHNNDRNNGYAIADEGFFGDPNTTGTISNPGYGGGHGPTEPPADVIIGDRRNGFINSLITDKLSAESGTPGRHYLVERTSGVDGGNALFTAAGSSGVTKLAGLFDHFYHNADGLGGTAADRLENPALPESTLAALTVLNKDPHGFVLMIEGGAIDWAGHANNMDHLIGEMQKFNDTVQAVIDWINNPGNGSSWNNALLIVTSDHECGYLTKDLTCKLDRPEP